MNEDTFRMRHFAAGKEVEYDRFKYTVDHVTLRGYQIFVHLKGKDGMIPSEQIWCEPTVFSKKRKE